MALLESADSLGSGARLAEPTKARCCNPPRSSFQFQEKVPVDGSGSVERFPDRLYGVISTVSEDLGLYLQLAPAVKVTALGVDVHEALGQASRSSFSA